MDWFSVEENEIKDLLYQDFQHIPIIEGCDISTSVDTPLSQSIEVNVAPNPFSNYVKVSFTSYDERVRVSLFDSRGAVLKVIADQQFSKGEHSLSVEMTSYASGTYFIRLEAGQRQKTKRIVKS